MRSSRNSNRPPLEELITYALLMITGAIPVINAVQAGGRFGVEATIGAIMIGAGGLGVIAYAWAQSAGGDGGGSRNR